jgi:DNA-binding transcriptional ArsR family regulator
MEGGDLDISVIGALVADRARCRILLALADGRALPASHLAADAEVTPATASSHLGKLVKAGLLTVESRGRYRYYKQSGPDVGDLIEALERFAPAVMTNSLRQSRRTHAVREARTCYDHLAGRLGVGVMRAMIEREHLAPEADSSDTLAAADRTEYRLTEQGASFLDELGVRIPPNRRIVRFHLDTTEQLPHLSGVLGRGLLDRFTELGWVQRSAESRAVKVTSDGIWGFGAHFGIDLT